MRIALVNASDAKGGAARVALSLARGLIARGHDVTYVVANRTLDEPWIAPLPQTTPDTRSLAWRLTHRLGLNTLNLTSPHPRSHPASYWRNFDLIHLHDVPMFNWAALPWLSRLAPLVWTLHSPAAFTGNCVFPFGCERFTASCGACPQYGRFPLHWLHRDGSRGVLLLKRLIARRLRIASVIGVSEWTSAQARRSLLGRFPIQTIPNAIDTEVFQSHDQTAARRHLGLPLEKKIILISAAANPLDHRKGYDIALAALARLSAPDILLLSLGIDAAPSTTTPPDPRILPARHLANDPDLNLHYAAADLVWHPSRADTSSMVAMEAMASGTPVIAAAIGGVPEVVGTGPDAGGVLIPADDPDALAATTHELLFGEPTALQKLAQSARSRCIDNFSAPRFVNDHESLYKTVANNQR